MLPFVYSAGLSPNAVLDTTLVLPANGGSVAIPFILADTICAQTVTVRTTDVSLAHTLEVRWYSDRAMEQVGPFQSFTFTAVAAANRTPGLASPIYLPAGLAWAVVRNAGANSTSLAAVSTSAMGGALCAIATLAQSLSIGLNNPAWVASTVVPYVRINGSLSGILPGATI
jgi:hypothetical protein